MIELNKRTFCLIAPILALILLTTPVMAVPKTKGLYTQVILSQVVFNGNNFVTDDLLHIRNRIGQGFSYQISYPLANWISSSDVGNGQLDLISLTGDYVGQTIDTFENGDLEGIISIKFSGPGIYTYMGPTFTFTLNSITRILTTGDMFGGLLYELMAVKHGTGDLAGFSAKGTSSGISIQGVIIGDPNMVGISLDVETGEYIW